MLTDVASKGSVAQATAVWGTCVLISFAGSHHFSQLIKLYCIAKNIAQSVAHFPRKEQNVLLNLIARALTVTGFNHQK